MSGTQVATVSDSGRTVTRAEELESTARLLQKKWGPALSLPVGDLAKVVKICEDSGMNPFFHLDVLGDKLYDNADFWREVLAADPRVVSFEQKRIRPGSDEWDEFIAVEEDDVIAAAVLTTIEMDGRLLPIQEVNYVTADDPILGEWSEPHWFDKNQGAEAKALADSMEQDGKAANLFTTKNGFGVKYKVRRPDWMALALKKARSTSARRAARLAIPRTHAQVLLSMDRVASLEEAHQEGGAEATIRSPDDPYGSPAPVERQVRGPSVISERHRSMIFAMANKRGFDSYELKELIAKTLNIEPEDVSTSALDYEQFAEIVEVLDAMPEESVGDYEQGSLLDDTQEAEVVQ